MFTGYTISYYRDAWVHSVVDVTNDNGQYQHFRFTLTKPTNAFIGVHYYPSRMYPTDVAKTCRKGGYTSGSYTIISSSLFGFFHILQFHFHYHLSSEQGHSREFASRSSLPDSILLCLDLFFQLVY